MGAKSRIEGFKGGYSEGYDIGQADKRKKIIELIEEMRKEPKKISEKSGGLDDYAKGQLDVLHDLKQKLKGE